MSFQSKGFEAVAGIEPERALNIGVGIVQAPMWAAFYASAGFGAAWWWSTAWTRTLPNFDIAALLAPEPTPPAEAYIEALDDAVCDLIETSQDVVEEKAEAQLELVEAVQESAEFASETTADAVTDAADAVVEAIPEPLIEAAPELVEAPAEPVIETPATEAAAAPLAFAADEETPVVELVTIEPTVETIAAKPAFKASKKKSPKA